MPSSAQPDDELPEFPEGKILLTILCYRCGYNLKGVDPAGACPECGSPVWPSLRPYVDPSDIRMALLDRPKRIGTALIVVSAAMLIGAGALWWPYLMALIRQMRAPGAPLNLEITVWQYAIVGGLAAAALLATYGLQHPTGAHASAEYRRGLNLARFGLLAWALLHGLLAFYDSWAPQPVQEWFDLVHVDTIRTLLRLALDGAALTMILGFRPVVRSLARHSIPHRLGGASRQGFLAVFVAIVAVGCGDVLRLLTRALDFLGFAGLLIDNAALIGTMLVLIGSAMMTLALLNLAIDSTRLARILARPLYRLDQAVG